MLRIHRGFLRLVSTVTMVVSMGALSSLQAPAQASSVAPSDSAIGPNTLFVGPTAVGATRVAACLDMPVSSALIQPSTCFVTGPTSDLISGSIPGDSRTGRVVSVLDQQVRKLDFGGAGRVDVSGINRNHACLHSASGQNGELDIDTMQVAPTPTASCPAGAAAGGLRPTALNNASHSGAPLATTAASEVLASGLAASNGPPAPAASYYVWYALGSECGPGATTGCRLYVDGANEPSPAAGALVVLDFGAPCFVPGSNPTIYGVQLFNTPAMNGSPPQCSRDANLAPLIQAWINGYESTHGVGTPTAVLAVGSSNSLTGADPQTNFSLTTDQMNAAGQAWFNTVVKTTAAALKGPAPIVAWSANDLEQAADGNWYGPGPSRAWVDGYGTAAGSALSATKSCTGSDPYRLADYGDAVTKSWTTTDGGGWTDADIYYVAWGASASCAVPEVYIPAMASEWAQVSQEATQNGLAAISFTGPMSEGGEANTLSAADSWNNLAVDTGQSPPYLTVIGVLNPTVPGAPTGVVGVPGEASVTVSWSAPADGGSPITRYTVSAIDNTGALAQTTTVTGLPPPTSATVKGLIDFTAYTFTVTATNAAGVGPASTPSSPVVPGSAAPRPSTFYFAEGFTGGGFNETLYLFMPGSTGTATVDFYTEQGHLPTVPVVLTAGKVSTLNVNQVVGANHNVSAVVNFPAPGVAERVMHFNNGNWHGSTANVGVASPANEWDFAEGSTFGAFSEYLTLENPSGTAAPVTLNYMTDGSPGANTAQRTLTLPANSRTTVPVFQGSMTGPSSCVINAGTAVNCGVGPGVLGVSTQVLSPSVAIVAERPMYVNGFNFGDGIIHDGHDAFGVNAASDHWNFAEGTTIAGFREYLTLENPGASDATVTLKYVESTGVASTSTVTVAHQSRATVPVFDAQHNGVGPGLSDVSVAITSTQPIVAERPMYMVFNFGSGVVAGAHDVTGSIAGATLFEFSYASTAAGENDFLTIQNLNSSSANLNISYYGPAGSTVRALQVAGNSRHTIAIWTTGSESAGPNHSPLAVVVVSDQPVLVEEPTYNAYSMTYGATDTIGYMPPTS